MNNKNYLFYPYTNRSFGFIKGLLAKNIDFDVISPKGFGLQNRDIAYSVNKKDLGKKVKSLNDIQFKNYDSIILSSYIEEDTIKDELTKLIEQSIENDLEIVSLKQEKSSIEKLCNYKKLKKYDLGVNEAIEKTINKFNELNLPLYSSNNPVIFVGGIFDYIDNYNISLQVKIKLEDEGYNVILITNEKDLEYFGTLRYPKEFMNPEVEPVEQIIILNRFIQALEYIYHPDLIILHHPEGMLMYNKYYHNTFGIYTYFLCQSIRPDYLIMNIPLSLFKLEYIKSLSKQIGNTLGQKVNIFNITNEEYEIGNQTISRLESPTYLNEEEINKILNIYSGKVNNVFNFNDDKQIKNAISKIINDLSGDD